MENGRYEVLETIGTGAAGRVVKARDTRIGRIVALKTLLSELTEIGSPEKFLHEARIIGQLNHPSIVGLFDVGIEEQGNPYLVMEYVEGKTLEPVLASGPIPLQKACIWCADLAKALSRAHQAGIIHGDVKPANILLTEEGRVKLGDFGIARFVTQMSCSGKVLGTPAYLSPEQIEGKPQDGRSDLFSLGILLYQLVTGMRPFDGTSLGAVCAQILNATPPLPSRLNPQIPPAFDRVIQRCLAKDPDKRYASGEELARDLYPFARSVPQSASPWRQLWTAQPFLRGAVWVTGALALLAAVYFPAAPQVRAHLRIPPTPETVVYVPIAPADLLGYAKVDRFAVTHIEEPLAEVPAPAELVLPAKIAVKKVARHSNAPARPRPAATQTLAASETQPKLPAPAPGPAFPEGMITETRRAPLQIEIQAHVAGATLAVFADRELLFTTTLSADGPNIPLRVERKVPLGPHQFRVAIYRPDRSLQTEKEGLAEIRGDTENKLAIQIRHHSRFFLLHDNALEVTWPDAAAYPDANSAARATAVPAALN
jgi:tRNA A-37 threonylcarbamoyl transferase component Bud32